MKQLQSNKSHVPLLCWQFLSIFVIQIILECTTTADLQLTESLFNMNWISSDYFSIFSKDQIFYTVITILKCVGWGGGNRSTQSSNTFSTLFRGKCYCHNVILTKTIYAQSLFSRDNLKLFVSWHFLNILILQLTQTSLTQPHLFNIKCYNGLNWLPNFLFLTYSPLTISLEV